MGHSEDSNEPIDPTSVQETAKKAGNTRKVILGDDLGAERYIHFIGRLDFLNIPFLRRFSIKPFLFSELVFYPPYTSNYSGLSALDQFKKYSRCGLGFGFSVPLPIGDMLSFHLYQNVLMFNSSHKGDIIRNSFVELDIGFY